MLYFLKHPETGLIKIGKTMYFHSRKAMLDNEYGHLELLGLMEGYTELEQRLHQQFTHLRERNKLAGNEWFRPAPELMGYIQENATADVPQPYVTVAIPPLAYEVFQILQRQYQTLNMGDAIMAFLEDADPNAVDLAVEALELRERLESMYDEIETIPDDDSEDES